MADEKHRLIGQTVDEAEAFVCANHKGMLIVRDYRDRWVETRNRDGKFKVTAWLDVYGRIAKVLLPTLDKPRIRTDHAP